MALRSYATYAAPAEEVWRAVLGVTADNRGLRVEGYAKEVRYRAWGGWLAYQQEVEIRVSPLGERRCTVSMRVHARWGRWSLTERPRQEELLAAVSAALGSRFPRESGNVEVERQGCVLLLALGAVGAGWLVVPILATARGAQPGESSQEGLRDRHEEGARARASWGP